MTSEVDGDGWGRSDSVFHSYHNGIRSAVEPSEIYFFGIIDILQVSKNYDVRNLYTTINQYYLS